MNMMINISPLNMTNKMYKPAMPYLWLVLLFVGLSAGAQKSNIPVSSEYYKPYRSPLPASYAYAELGFTRPRGLSDNTYNSKEPSDYKGYNFRVGIVRAFTLNKYKYDKLSGYHGKKNKLYMQFSFGWDFQSGFMTVHHLDRYTAFESSSVSFNGLDLGIGLVQNIGNIVAIEANYYILPFPMVKSLGENIKDYSKGKFIYTYSTAIRVKHLSLNFNWSYLSFKFVDSSGVESEDRLRFGGFSWSLKYVYGF